jgi:hypothetical protein
MAGRLNSIRWTAGARWGVCALAVLALHAWVGRSLADHMAEWGDAGAMPPRMDVAFVRDMEVVAPPAVAALPSVRAAPAPRAKRAPAAPSPAASQPQSPPAEPEPVKPEEKSIAEVKPVLVEPVIAAAVEAVPEVVAPSPTAEAPPSAPNFVWPGPTRLSYVLTGNYRGEINGSAQVEWLRTGSRYQVHLDVLVGLPVAPLITRRMSSEGQITPEGLVPERFEEDTKIMFRDRRRVGVRFDADTIVMANGERQPRPMGVQDSASQFVQLSYLFSINPQLLTVGGTVKVPLALARKIDTWTYDVVAEEALITPFGEIASYHLKPRRVGQNTNDLTAEMWIAPSLQYLPARIRIRQDADTFIDMLIERKPQLAAAN